MFALAYIVLSENLQAKVFGTSVGIIAAINGGVGGVDGYMGGLMAETLGFRSIFVVVLVLTAIAALCIFRLVPAGRPAGVRGAMDWWGAGSLSLFLVFLTYFVSDGSAAGWTSPTALALLAGTVVSFAGFWFIEKRRSHPLIAVHHLRSRQVWPVIATTVLTLAGIFAVINFTVVLLSQDSDGGFGLSASISALLFLTPGTTSAGTSPLINCPRIAGNPKPTSGVWVLYIHGLPLLAGRGAGVWVFSTRVWVMGEHPHCGRGFSFAAHPDPYCHPHRWPDGRDGRLEFGCREDG